MALLLLALFVTTSQPAPGLDVQWRGDAGCDEHVFHGSLQRWLAHTAAPRPLQVVVEARAVGDGRFVARLELADAHDRTSRELHGASCDEVAQAAAFVTAVAVDPGVLAPRPGPPNRPAPELAPEPPSGPSSVPPVSELELDEPPASPPTPRRLPLAALVRVGAGLEALGMPRVGPLAQLAVGLQGRRWRVELVGLYRAPTPIVAERLPHVGAQIGLWTAGARGCGVVRPGPLELPLCLGLELGQALARAHGFPDAGRGQLPWLAAVAAPALAWAPRRLAGVVAVWAGLELGLPLRRGVFAVHGLGDLYPTGPVSLRVTLGVEVRIVGARPKDSARPGK